MDFTKYQLAKEELLHIYKYLVKPRIIEEKMLKLLRQGKVSKWFSGIGQEAISVGATLALHHDEYILPLHRNLGVFTTRNIPFQKLFAQWQGKKSGFTKGRDRSFHFGTNEYHIIGMISHLGAMLGVADGIALAEKIDKTSKCALVFSGDGGASEGDFHEAINTAAVWNLPVIFLIENNGYGLSTPSNEQYKQQYFIDKGIGYGIEAIQIDGNHILEVYTTIKKIAEDIRQNPRPILLECMTFRMRGHEEASGTKYVPQHLFDEWQTKDPISNYENYLINNDILTSELKEQIALDIKKEIEDGLNVVFDEPEIIGNIEEELKDVYAEYTYNPQSDFKKINSSTSEFRMIDAISNALKLSMEKYPQLILMGQDIADYGGVFKITDGFVSQFGKERVRNTPLCESAIVGASYGLSIKHKKAMMEMQFADFVTCGFNQIVNNLAKSHYRWGQNADVVIRMPTGAGTGAGPFHSQSNEAWFCKVPGLKIVYPSSPIDAKGLLIESFNDPNPILFFEHKGLYRQLKEQVPDEYYTIEIGKANIVSEGSDMGIITYGWGVHWALSYCKKLNINAEILDLRTLLPFDKEAIKKLVIKTGKILILHEDTITCGIGSEISAWINEHCFEYLDAPVKRVASLDTPIPLAPDLEQQFLANHYLENAILELSAY